jgi:hypothetical protein
MADQEDYRNARLQGSHLECLRLAVSGRCHIAYDFGGTTLRPLALRRAITAEWCMTQERAFCFNQVFRHKMHRLFGILLL